MISQIPEMALANAAPQNSIEITMGAIGRLNERKTPTMWCLQAYSGRTQSFLWLTVGEQS